MLTPLFSFLSGPQTRYIQSIFRCPSKRGDFKEIITQKVPSEPNATVNGTEAF